MNRRILSIVGSIVCASFIEAAHAADVITLRYGQNAALAGTLLCFHVLIPMIDPAIPPRFCHYRCQHYCATALGDVFIDRERWCVPHRQPSGTKEELR